MDTLDVDGSSFLFTLAGAFHAVAEVADDPVEVRRLCDRFVEVLLTAAG